MKKPVTSLSFPCLRPCRFVWDRFADQYVISEVWRDELQRPGHMGSLSPSSSPLAQKRCPEFGFSRLSASLIDLPVTHEDPPVTATMMPTLTQTHPFRTRSRLVYAPSLDPSQLRRRQSFVIRKSLTTIAPAAVIPRHFMDAKDAFPGGKEDPPHSSWPSGSEIAVWMHNTNATGDVRPCDGISAILSQHKACPDCDDDERTRPVTNPSVRTSQPICPHFVPLDMAHGTYDASLT